MADWFDQGCRQCRAGIVTGSLDLPLRVAENLAARAFLLRCDLCASWWIENEREAHVIPGEEARSRFPAYFAQHPDAPA